MCAGSGVLAIVAAQSGASRVTAVDISRRAVLATRLNAKLNRVRVRAVRGDLFAAVPGERFDLIVSNPPYVATAEIATLAPEVRDHDPRHALDGGADGLAAYRAIAADALRLLRPRGHLVVEIGAGQEHDVTGVFAAAGLAITDTCHDLSGVRRALAAARR